MYSSASQYSRHHSMQEHFAKLFVSSIVSRMDWSRESADTVMDLGCGSGNTTLHILRPAFPDVRKIVAVDVLPSMIAHAREKCAHRKIEYYEANIEDKCAMQRWKHQMTKVLSIYCFHWLKQQREGFQNIYDVLQPGGEAALLFVVKSPFWDSYEELVSNPKWNGFLKDVDQCIPKTNFMKDCTSHYKDMLGDIGFEVLAFEETERCFTFGDDNECKNSITALSTLVNHMPEDLKGEFQEDLFQGFVKYNLRNSDGRPNSYHTSLSLLLRKPAES